jgi:signal transduction histidine kinase
MAERARAAAGASAAILSAGLDRTPVVAGALPEAAQGLARAVAALALPALASGEGVGVRQGEGEAPCSDVLALQSRFGLTGLAVVHWPEGETAGWVALASAGAGDSGPLTAQRLREIGESLRERCALLTKVTEATLLVERLEDVARASGDWSWETDEQNRYTWVSGTLPGASHADVRLPAIGEVIPSGLVVDWRGEPETPLRDFHAVLHEGGAIVRLVTREYTRGKARYVSRSAVPLRHADGSLRGFRGSARDVTESLEAKRGLWQRDEALRAAKEKAEASSRAKSMLVSKVGHELRAPLNAIVGLAQLIQARDVPADHETVERWVAQIAKTGWQMVDVLDMLMEVGRAGAMVASIASTPVDLVEIVREAIDLVERDAHARSIRIAFEAVGSVQAIVDRRAIHQVVVNLLGNAIKYNRDAGSVRVSVTQGDECRVEVSDTGRGLTREQLARLFRPFERLGAEHSGVAGHGLGLLICKELVASMHGKLQVRSKVGQGTTFTVVLPLPANSRTAGGDSVSSRMIA